MPVDGIDQPGYPQPVPQAQESHLQAEKPEATAHVVGGRMAAGKVLKAVGTQMPAMRWIVPRTKR